MPIDYSKWDNLDVSSSDEEGDSAAGGNAGAVRTAHDVAKIQEVKPAVAKGKKASGASKWNANNYHHEETKLDDWAKTSLTELFAKARARDEIELADAGQRLVFL